MERVLQNFSNTRNNESTISQAQKCIIGFLTINIPQIEQSILLKKMEEGDVSKLR